MRKYLLLLLIGVICIALNVTGQRAQTSVTGVNMPLSFTPYIVEEIPCSNYMITHGTAANEEIIDATVIGPDVYFTGHTGFSGNQDIFVNKTNHKGKIIWSRRIGGDGDEWIRKITPAGDGGVLVTGQTKTVDARGEIFCFKMSAGGAIQWQRRYGLSSAYGDLGMDIIPTSDGGYAVNGIINVSGFLADMVIIKLDKNANIQWTKRFNRSDAEDGVGILEHKNELLVACDMQRGFGHYEFSISRLNMTDGSVIGAKIYTPEISGLFNPHLLKDPAGKGFLVSGHTVNYDNYATMKHTVLSIDEAFNLQSTRTVEVSPQANNFYTGFLPLPDGSFIGCASPQENTAGYVYRIGPDNSVMYAYQFPAENSGKPIRLTATGTHLLVVGSIIQNGQTEGMITAFSINGNADGMCGIKAYPIGVSNPVFTTSDFKWPSIVEPSFQNIQTNLTVVDLTIEEKDICAGLPEIDFSYKRDLCEPLKVQLFANAVTGAKIRWDFGNGQMVNDQYDPVFAFNNTGSYNVKLEMEASNGCKTSLIKQVRVTNLLDPNLITNANATICSGDSVALNTQGSFAFCWKTDASPIPTSLRAFVKPQTKTTYHLTGQIKGPNLVINPGFESGASGFQTDFTETTSPGNDVFAVKTSAAGGWSANQNNCVDRTTGNGNMLLVQKGALTGKTVWSQKITVMPNTEYLLEAWFLNLAANGNSKLSILINGVVVSGAIAIDGQNCSWKSESLYWSSGTNTEALISFKDVGSASSTGNTFAIDEIFFGTSEFRHDMVTIDVKKGPEITFEKEIKFCPGEAVQLEVATNDIDAAIVWEKPELLDQTKPWQPLFKQPKTETFGFTVVLPNGCKKIDSIQVITAAIPEITLPKDTSMCAGAQLLMPISAKNVALVTWLPADGLSNSQTLQPFVSPEVSTQYEILAKSGDGCTVTQSILINVNKRPELITIADTAICQDQSIQLNASGGDFYRWEPSPSLSDFISDKPVATPVVSSKYIVRAYSNWGCFAIDIVSVNVKAQPKFALTADKTEVCVGEKIELNVSGGSEYLWLHNNTKTQSGQLTVYPQGEMQYKVVASEPVCNATDTLSINLAGHALPVAKVAISGSINCMQQSVTLYASGGTRYEWEPSPTLSNTNTQAPVASSIETTTYKVKVFSERGCYSEVTTTVNVSFSGGRLYALPNAFTPNGDGLNDCFSAKSWGYMQSFSLVIFNRWGEEVFRTTDPAACWNGYFKGQQQPAGVYVYIVNGKSPCGDVNQKGFVNLIR